MSTPPAAPSAFCYVYWGSHGCRLLRHHTGPCICTCCECDDHTTQHHDVCVGAPPYYGDHTVFYGPDAAARGLPTTSPIPH